MNQLMKYSTFLVLLLGVTAYSTYSSEGDLGSLPSSLQLDEVQPSSEDSLLTDSLRNYTIFLKQCNRHIGLTLDHSYLQQTQPDCISATQHIVHSYPTNELMNALTSKYTQISTRLKSTFKNLSDIDLDSIESINTYLNAHPVRTSGVIDFYDMIRPETVKFMFSLCVKSYNDNRFSLNENNVSAEYIKQQNQFKSDVKRLEGLLQKINNFKAFKDREIENTIVRLKNTTKERNSIETVEKINLLSSFQEENMDMESSSPSSDISEQKRSELKKKDIELKSLFPELLQALSLQYNLTFRGEKLETQGELNLSDIEEKVSHLELETQNKLVDAQRSLAIFSDPRVGEFWAKLEMMFDHEADGFMPIDVLYRTVNPHTRNILNANPVTGTFVQTKDNPYAKVDDNKEFSGIILFKPDESSHAHKIDQTIIAFSGSNSKEDWMHNLDAFIVEGFARHDLASGLKAHQGILTSLEESFDEAGTKLKSWIKRYEQRIKSYQEKPTLRIYLTGHSLGGALALLMGVHIKKVIEPYVRNKFNIEVKIYTFGAPPIFHRGSAAEVEALLGHDNINRFYVIGDPVSNISLLKKHEKTFKDSPLMALVGYTHVGVGIPLYDNKNMADFFDNINIWKHHLANRYNNLIVTNWKDLISSRSNQIYNQMLQQDVVDDLRLQLPLKSLIEFMQYPTEKPTLLLEGVTPQSIVTIVEDMNKPQEMNAPIIANYKKIMDERNRAGLEKEPQFSKEDIVPEMKYTHVLPGSLTGINVVIKRDTSCEFAKLVPDKTVQNRFTPFPNSKEELSCGCCLVKNIFVSNDDSVASFFRRIGGKKTSTVDEVVQYCEKHCSKIRPSIFLRSKANVDNLSAFMDKLGIGSQWQNKKLIVDK